MSDQRASSEQDAERRRATATRPADEQDDAGDERPQFPPVSPPIGEGPDNLRQREEWFRRRTGGQP